VEEGHLLRDAADRLVALRRAADIGTDSLAFAAIERGEAAIVSDV
jgi:hypothetical protein